MYTITVVTDTFIKNVTVNYWKDNLLINSELCAVADLPQFLAERQEVERITLFGNREYNQGLKEDIEKLSENKIEIEVI